MDDYNNEISNLKQYIKDLYTRTGKLNLYVCLCKPDMTRLKLETEKLKQLVVNIENEIDNI